MGIQSLDPGGCGANLVGSVLDLPEEWNMGGEGSGNLVVSSLLLWGNHVLVFLSSALADRAVEEQRFSVLGDGDERSHSTQSETSSMDS